MSWHGKQHRGAAREWRAEKKEQAESRAANNTVINCVCGNRHASGWSGCPNYAWNRHVLETIFAGGDQ